MEHYKYTDKECDECNGKVVYDEHRDEYYCLKCGLINNEKERPFKNENHTREKLQDNNEKQDRLQDTDTNRSIQGYKRCNQTIPISYRE